MQASDTMLLRSRVWYLYLWVLDGDRTAWQRGRPS
jgi:hypothetical protein